MATIIEPLKQAPTARLRTISQQELEGVQPSLLDPIDYRKSGLSLNHVIGCPLDCAYCVRHLFENFDMKKPRALMSDEDAVAALVSHRYFVPHRTPLQIFNRATDPFLPNVKPSTFRVLELLAERGLSNYLLLITRHRVTSEDAARLNRFAPLKVALLITHSGIDDLRIEPASSDIAATSLKTAFDHARNYRVMQYWRPIVPGLNDSDRHIERAAELSRSAHATAFTGLFFRPEIRQFYDTHGIPVPYEETARRKVMPKALEARILAGFADMGGRSLFRKTSCAITFAYSAPDYNGHYGVRELCDICPAEQVERCAKAWTRPSDNDVRSLMEDIGLSNRYTIGPRAVEFECLDEQPRYYMQHGLRYQAHDSRRPHFLGRHGRAEIGWQAENDEVEP